MVSVKQEAFRSCEVHTITGTPKDVKIVMGYLVGDRRGIVVRRNFTDKRGEVVVELPR